MTPRPLLGLALALLPAIAGANGLALMTITPCRLLDTRHPAQGETWTLAPGRIWPVMAVAKCAIPANAVVLEANVTVTAARGEGHLSILLPQGAMPPPPVVSTTSLINYREGTTRANSAQIALSPIGGFWLLANGSATDVIVDVSGYYVRQ
jgi:hypothetical protein